MQQVWTDNIKENSANWSNQLFQAVTQPANFEDLLEGFQPPTSDFASPMSKLEVNKWMDLYSYLCIWGGDKQD